MILLHKNLQLRGINHHISPLTLYNNSVFFPILTFFGGKTKINFIHQTERFFCWEISVSPPLGMPQSEATRLSYDFVRQKKKHHGLQVNKHVGGPPKIVVFTPQIIHFHRVFHEINHPFWGTIIFGNMLNFGGV